MRRAVPLATRTLLAQRRRLVASVLGVGLSIMLMLLLDGMWVGVRAQVTGYEDNTGASLVVVAPGTENLFADSSVLPISTVDRVAATPGVRWAAPVRTMYTILDLHGGRFAASLVGAVPGRPGGPWQVKQGRALRSEDETTVDGTLAKRHGLRIGDDLEVMGRRFRIVGLTATGSTFMTGMVFLTHSAVEQLLQAPGATGAVLVGTDSPAAVATALQAQGLTVRTREQLREADLALMTKVFGSPMRLMVGIALLAGTLVIALTAYGAVVEHRRELGVVKALGATTRRMSRLALAQSLAVAAAGVVVGLGLFALGRELVGMWRPQFLVLLTSQTITRALLAALVMAVIAALIPARRLAKLDPAAAFRSLP